ncbi:MAG: FecR domain-containing protein [Verrucomicrobia bacterium]|nr:FecR domain-containing protein [Verrucomicrobiota bacterium]
MSNRSQNRPSVPGIEKEAAQWLARRDRGLSSAEQDDYLQWLRQDARHGEALARHEATLRRMMRLGDWQPALSDEPNPDLFAPRRRLPWRAFVAGTAAAAALAVGGALWWPAGPAVPAVAQKSYLRINEREALPDGSLVELKDGSRIAIEFSEAERCVRLIGGEVHFTVAKNSARPFVVETGGVAIRAVGTAFNVRLDVAAVEVLVTEGKVAVQQTTDHGLRTTDRAASARVPDAALETRDSRSGEAAPSSALRSPPSGTLLVAGQRALVSLAAAAPELRVTNVTPQEIKDTLAWQAPRLQFFETPLAVAVAEFNARNRTQLVLGEPDLGTVPIGGTFRVDNVEGFVRMIEVTLDLRAEPRGGNELVLTRSR